MTPATTPTMPPHGAAAALTAALHRVHGPAASLQHWTTHPLKRGRSRTIRFDVYARVPDIRGIHHARWVGKVYDRDGDARRAARVQETLAAADRRCTGMIVPDVVAYYAPSHLLLMRYEGGLSLTAAIAHQDAVVLPALARALAALHAATVPVDALHSPMSVLDDLRPKVAELGVRVPRKAGRLRHILAFLEQGAPEPWAAPSFVHGDLGPAQLLWQWGNVVVLDFDDCGHGDPALDLGNLLTQLYRLTRRKPGKLPAVTTLRRTFLEAYRRCAPPDPGLPARVAWYELATLVRKIHLLLCDETRPGHQSADAIQKRHAEALDLVGAL